MAAAAAAVVPPPCYVVLCTSTLVQLSKHKYFAVGAVVFVGIVDKWDFYFSTGPSKQCTVGGSK